MVKPSLGSVAVNTLNDPLVADRLIHDRLDTLRLGVVLIVLLTNCILFPVVSKS